MTRGEIFEVWAPAGALWSAWAKPVLFAHLGPRTVLPQSPEIHLDWAHRADGESAVVVDLPGASGVAVGLHLAQLGYRPVPLYNACPSPDTAAVPGPTIVDVEPIMAELFGGTERLSRLMLPPTAPPAFLLDDRRRYGEHGCAGARYFRQPFRQPPDGFSISQPVAGSWHPACRARPGALHAPPRGSLPHARPVAGGGYRGPGCQSQHAGSCEVHCSSKTYDVSANLAARPRHDGPASQPARRIRRSAAGAVDWLSRSPV